MATEISTRKALVSLVVIIVVIYGILIATGRAKNPFSSYGGREGDTRNQDGDLKCELRGSNGQIITITGRGPEFESLCRQNSVNLWGYQWYPLYYYYWYPSWGWRRHSGGRHPSGGHGSGTGGGTGGGGGTGTGAGTGTPGTGTP